MLSLTYYESLFIYWFSFPTVSAYREAGAWHECSTKVSLSWMASLNLQGKILRTSGSFKAPFGTIFFSFHHVTRGTREMCVVCLPYIKINLI